MDRHGRVALVTGAGSGIGRAVALELARVGYRLVLAGRRPAPLHETAALMGGLGVSGDAVFVCPVDASDPMGVAELFGLVENRFGRLDLLFNNAGNALGCIPIDQIAFADWRKVMDANLASAFLCTQQAVALMKRQTPRGGRIINNGSVSAQVPRPGFAAYTMAKHAVTGLTRATALEGRPFGIECGQIDIGNADTSGLNEPVLAVQADGSLQPEPVMPVESVVQAVLFMANLPALATVPFLTITASGMPLGGRG